MQEYKIEMKISVQRGYIKLMNDSLEITRRIPRPSRIARMPFCKNSFAFYLVLFVDQNHYPKYKNIYLFYQ